MCKEAVKYVSETGKQYVNKNRQRNDEIADKV